VIISEEKFCFPLNLTIVIMIIINVRACVTTYQPTNFYTSYMAEVTSK